MTEGIISSPEEQRLYDAFLAEWKAYMASHDKLYAFSRKNETEQARAVLEDVPVRVFKVGFAGTPENLSTIAEITSDCSDAPVVAWMPPAWVYRLVVWPLTALSVFGGALGVGIGLGKSLIGIFLIVDLGYALIDPRVEVK